MEKGEIAQNEQFHLFPQCFYAICILNPLIATFQLSFAASLNLGRSENGISGEPFPDQTIVFTYLQYKSFENSLGKGETYS